MVVGWMIIQSIYKQLFKKKKKKKRKKKKEQDHHLNWKEERWKKTCTDIQVETDW
jgi:hypothetical protein